MASIDSRIALPIAVRRPVASDAMTSSSTSSSLVGAWTISANPANATMPICVPPSWPSTNDAAASSAAMSRLGGMSVAHMLRDTSIARTTVVRLVGHRDDRRRPGHREHQAAEPDDEQRERQVAAEPRRARDGRADERQAREAHAGPPPSQRPDPDDDEHRQDDQQHEPGASATGSVMASARTSAATSARRRAAARTRAPASSGVSSNGSVRTTSRLPTSS